VSNWQVDSVMFCFVKVARLLALEFVAKRAQFVQVAGMIICMISVNVIHFGHALGPIWYFGPFDHAIKSQVSIYIGTLASFVWSDS
jgi:hypothetical protein